MSWHSYPFKNCIPHSESSNTSQTGLKTWKDILVSRGRQLQLLRDMRFTSFSAQFSKLFYVPKFMEESWFFLLLLFHFVFLQVLCYWGALLQIQLKTHLQMSFKYILCKAMGFPLFWCLLGILPSLLIALRVSNTCLMALKFWDAACMA